MNECVLNWYKQASARNIFHCLIAQLDAVVSRRPALTGAERWRTSGEEVSRVSFLLLSSVCPPCVTSWADGDSVLVAELVVEVAKNSDSFTRQSAPYAFIL